MPVNTVDNTSSTKAKLSQSTALHNPDVKSALRESADFIRAMDGLRTGVLGRESRLNPDVKSEKAAPSQVQTSRGPTLTKEPTKQVQAPEQDPIQLAIKEMGIKEQQKIQFIQEVLKNESMEKGILGGDVKDTVDPKGKVAELSKEFDTLKDKGHDPLKFEQERHKYAEASIGNQLKEGMLNAKVDVNQTREKFGELVEKSGEKDLGKAAQYAHDYEEAQHKFVEQVKDNRGAEGVLNAKAVDSGKTRKEFDQLVEMSGEKGQGAKGLEHATEFANQYEAARHEFVGQVKENRSAECGIDAKAVDSTKVAADFDKQVGASGAVTHDKNGKPSLNLEEGAKYAQNYEEARHGVVEKVKTNKQTELSDPLARLQPHEAEKARGEFDKEADKQRGQKAAGQAPPSVEEIAKGTLKKENVRHEFVMEKITEAETNLNQEGQTLSRTKRGEISEKGRESIDNAGGSKVAAEALFSGKTEMPQNRNKVNATEAMMNKEDRVQEAPVQQMGSIAAGNDMSVRTERRPELTAKLDGVDAADLDRATKGMKDKGATMSEANEAKKSNTTAVSAEVRAQNQAQDNGR